MKTFHFEPLPGGTYGLVLTVLKDFSWDDYNLCALIKVTVFDETKPMTRESQIYQ